jgi:acyl-CoA thioester hydrolase
VSLEPEPRLVYATPVSATPHFVFSMEIHAQAEEIDDLNHVSNLVYLRWVQDVATAHSRAIGYDIEDYRRLGAVFVIRRHEIDYLRSAMLGDRIVLRTWIDTWKAVSSVRMTSIVRVGGPGDAPGEASDVELARARTTWAFVSTDNGRPVRIPPELRDRFLHPVL